MANTSSAKKQIRTQVGRVVRNQVRREAYKDARKAVKKLLEGKPSADEVTASLSAFYKAVDKASKTNVIHKNAAARYKSRLTKLVNSKLQAA